MLVGDTGGHGGGGSVRCEDGGLLRVGRTASRQEGMPRLQPGCRATQLGQLDAVLGRTPQVWWDWGSRERSSCCAWLLLTTLLSAGACSAGAPRPCPAAAAVSGELAAWPEADLQAASDDGVSDEVGENVCFARIYSRVLVGEHDCRGGIHSGGIYPAVNASPKGLKLGGGLAREPMGQSAAIPADALAAAKPIWPMTRGRGNDACPFLHPAQAFPPSSQVPLRTPSSTHSRSRTNSTTTQLCSQTDDDGVRAAPAPLPCDGLRP